MRPVSARTTRFATPLLRLVAVLAVLGLGLVGPATAAHAAEKPDHVIRFLQVGETSRDGVFYVKGRLTQAKGHAVYLQARTAARPTWRTVTGQRSTKDTGRFAITWRGKCGAAYRIVVRESPSYARTTQRIARVECV